jgi:TPR repeat protein
VKLGTLYKFGLGVRQNYPTALHWFRLSARRGNALAEAFLGSMYTFGWGVPKDYAEAMGWYRKAAAHEDRAETQGIVSGEMGISYLYLHGWGVPKSCRKAQAWYREARTRGMPDIKSFDTRLNARGCTS